MLRGKGKERRGGYDQMQAGASPTQPSRLEMTVAGKYNNQVPREESLWD